MAAEQEAKSEQPAQTKPKKKTKTKLILIVVILLIMGGGAGWYFTKEEEIPLDDQAKAEAKSKEAEVKSSKPPVFLPIDPFTVNLIPEGPEDQFLQVGFSLKMTNKEVEDLIKKHLPEIRSHILLLLTSKTASDVSSIKGKQKLGYEILKIVNQTINPSQKASSEGSAESKDQNASESDPLVIGVLFNSFIIQ